MRERDEIGLDDDGARHTARMTEKLILVPSSRSAAFDEQSLARRHEHGIPPFLEAAEQRRNRNTERLRQTLQRGERRTRHPVLDLGEHAERQVRRPSKICSRNAELVAEGANFPADGNLEQAVARPGMRVLRFALALVGLGGALLPFEEAALEAGAAASRAVFCLLSVRIFMSYERFHGFKAG